MNCIFCQIIAGEIPSYKVYEDDQVFAFLDIAPINYGHILVIPKKHAANLEEIEASELEPLMRVVKLLGAAVIKSSVAEGYNVVVNNNAAAGQIVPHLHFHIIPRNTCDSLSTWPGGKYGDGEAEEALNKIKLAI